MRWLTTPELMTQWMVGAVAVETHADHFRLAMARGSGRRRERATFRGEVVEQGMRRLVRRYVLESRLAYARTVTYELAPALEGCAVTCTVVTDVEGLPDKQVRSGAKAEERSLPRSLDRLRLGAEQRRIGLWRRYRDAQLLPQAL